MAARDFAAIRELVAPDVVLRSPITSSFVFRGRDEVVGLLELVRDAYSELEYTAIFGEEDIWAQVFRARVRGQQAEGVDLMRLDAQGRVSEFTVFFRPLPGVTALLAALAPELAAGDRSRSRRLAALALTRPLAAMTRAGDRFAARLAGRGDR